MKITVDATVFMNSVFFFFLLSTRISLLCCSLIRSGSDFCFSDTNVSRDCASKKTSIYIFPIIHSDSSKKAVKVFSSTYICMRTYSS